MEQIVKIYGKFILEGIAIICLTGFLFYGISDDMGNRGFFKIIGKNLPVENEDYDTYDDFREIYQEESKKSAPKIIYIGGSLIVGNNRLPDVIKATDYSGRDLEIKILSIKNADEIEMIENYNFETSEINFSQSGIYIVTVKATDDCNKSSQCIIKIPVNSR